MQFLVHCSFLTSFFYPYLRVFDYLCCGESIFLHFVPSPKLLGSVCLCLHTCPRKDRCRAQKALPVTFSSWGRINFPPSSSPLMSLAPLCQLRCWGAQKWTWYSRCCLTSAKRKGRIISATFHMQVAITADSCWTLCWPPKSFPMKISCWHPISACRAEWCYPGPDVVLTALVGLQTFSIR